MPRRVRFLRPASGGRSSYAFEANWKLTIENFFDAYHVPFIHRDSLSKRNRALYETGALRAEAVRKLPVMGPFFPNIQEFPKGSACADLGMPVPPGLPEDWRWRNIYLYLFPNFLLFVHPDQIVGIVETPTSPGNSHQLMKIFFHGEAGMSAEKAQCREASIEFWRAVNTEDLDVCRTLQAGRESPAFDGGIFAPAWETQVHAFQRLVATRLSGQEVER